MKLIGYTLGLTKVEQHAQKAALHDQFPEIKKVYSESCSRNGTTGKPTRQTRGHALIALKNGDVLVTDKLERLAADGDELAGICSALLDEGVHIVSVDDKVDTREDSTLRNFMKKKTTSIKAATSLKEARDRGARTRHVRLPDETLAVINQAVQDGAPGRVRKELRRQLLAEHEQSILSMLKDGKGPMDISRETKLSDAVIRNIAKFHGVNVDRRFKNGKQGRILGERDQQELGKRISNGEKAADLAREYGVSYDVVYRVQRIVTGRIKLKRNDLKANT
jgi:DNA invertase Pin-like site-specific DNA recombinase